MLGLFHVLASVVWTMLGPQQFSKSVSGNPRTKSHF